MEKFDRQHIEQELKKLPREHIVQFAWRCGMRALPFLGTNANFDFWDVENRQKHLYAVFHALDFATSASSSYVTAAAASAAAYAAAASSATTAAAYAAAASSSSSSASSAAATAAAAAYAAAAKSGKGQEMIAAIRHDLKVAQGKKPEPLSVDLYGDVWENFQQALTAEGCAWWGRFYQKIFDDGLALSFEALERRLNIPEEIRESGAAVAGKYLEDREK